MPTTSRIPSVRTRVQQREASKRKSPVTNSPSSGVGAVSLPPRVGIYRPVLRGRHTKSLQKSIIGTREHHNHRKPLLAAARTRITIKIITTLKTVICDAKLVSSVLSGTKYRMSYDFASHINHFIPGAIDPDFAITITPLLHYPGGNNR
jgi:hypothetical protein